MKATSQVSGLVGFAAIGVILLFLTGPIRYLPSAVLGAVIVFASLKLIDPEQWRELARSSRVEVGIAAITALFVIIIGVLPAIVVAVALSIIDVVRRTATPNDAVLGYSAAENRYADLGTHPEAGVTPGVVVYRIQERLFFANAHFFKRRVWAAVDGAPKPVRHLVLDAAAISGVDASAVEAVREVHEGLRSRNITFEIARATDELRRAVRRHRPHRPDRGRSLPRNRLSSCRGLRRRARVVRPSRAQGLSALTLSGGDPRAWERSSRRPWTGAED